MNYEIHDNFFSKDECDKWIDYINVENDPKNNRFNRWDPILSNDLSIRSKKKCQMLDGNIFGSGRITFTKYNKNQKMSKHVDIINEPNIVYTGIVYLNDNFGNTILYLNNNTINVRPKQGRLLIFDINIPHEAIPPLETEKYVIIFRICHLLK